MRKERPGCECAIVKKSGCFPTLGRHPLVELRNDMTTAIAEPPPKSVHLFPKADGWIVIRGDRVEHAEHFSDLGKALDVATLGVQPVRVVVHERATGV